MRNCAGISGKALSPRSCLSRNVARRYRRQGTPAWSSRAATEAGLDIKAHAHMLRHACTYKLANDGHDTRAIRHSDGRRGGVLPDVSPKHQA